MFELSGEFIMTMELVPFRLFTLGKKILELRFLHSLERIFSCCLDVFSKDVLSSHLLVVDLAKVQVGKAGRVLWLVFPVVDLALAWCRGLQPSCTGNKSSPHIITVYGLATIIETRLHCNC